MEVILRILVFCRLCILDGSVWAVGGLDSNVALNVVERMDPREGKWVPVPSLSQKRSSAGLAALGKESFKCAYEESKRKGTRDRERRK